MFHRAKVISDNGIGEDLYAHLEEKEYSGNEILKNGPFQRRLQCIVEVFIRGASGFSFSLWGYTLFLTMASKGRLYCLGDEMSVYRRLSTGIINSQCESSLSYQKG